MFIHSITEYHWSNQRIKWKKLMLQKWNKIKGKNSLVKYDTAYCAVFYSMKIFNTFDHLLWLSFSSCNWLFFSYVRLHINFFSLYFTGKLRYANNSNYKNDTMIRKEVSKLLYFVLQISELRKHPCSIHFKLFTNVYKYFMRVTCDDVN